MIGEAEDKDVAALRERHAGETLKLIAYKDNPYPDGNWYAEEEISLESILDKKYHGILLHDDKFYTIITKAANSWRKYIKIGRADEKNVSKFGEVDVISYTPDEYAKKNANMHINTSYKITPQSTK